MDDCTSSAGERTHARGMRRNVQLTARDLELLAFAAEHRLVLAAHVQKLLGISAAAAAARLRSLAGAGYLTQERRFYRRPACYLIERDGLAAVGRGYSRPRFNYPEYEHDVGLAWLWLAACSGVLGNMQEVISERRMRSLDAAPDRTGAPMGVRLGGYGPSGAERLHYPDLLLITKNGDRVALELELTSKGRTRLEKILAGYAAEERIDVVLYLVERRSIGRPIEAATPRFGIENLVHVQLLRREDSAGSGSPTRVEVRRRAQLRSFDPGPGAGDARKRATQPQTAGR